MIRQRDLFHDDDVRDVLHLDLDSFFVSVERLRDSRLRGRPVVIGGSSGRGVVSSCSYEARRFGVHSAMPVKLARKLCSHAVFLRGDMEAYTQYSRMVTQVIHQEAPLYEKASIDEHYLDITGMDRYFGLLLWSKELRRRIIRETGLPLSMGLSVNKTVSKVVAGEVKPDGEGYVERSRVRSFLAPLPVDKLPMVGAERSRLLRSMGVFRVQTLQEMPPEMLMQVMGKSGLTLWKKANGIDPSPVVPYQERKSVSTETTFERETTHVHYIHRLLAGMVEDLAFSLRRQQKLASVVTIKIRYANFDTCTRQKRIAYTAFDHVLIPLVQELFDALYQRRMLLRLVGVRFSGLVGGAQQINMFEDTPEMVSLYQTMDHLRRRFGKDAVQRAEGMEEKQKHS